MPVSAARLVYQFICVRQEGEGWWWYRVQVTKFIIGINTYNKMHTDFKKGQIMGENYTYNI